MNNLKLSMTLPVLAIVCAASGCQATQSTAPKAEEKTSQGGSAQPAESRTNSNAAVANSAPDNAAPAKVNLLSLSSGAFVVKSTSKLAALKLFALIDDNQGSYGSAVSDDGEKSGEYIIALSEKTALDTLEFWGTSAPGDAESAKDVAVQMSDTSADAGFETIFEGSLTNEPIAAAQTFPVSKKVAGKWLKVIVKNNHGGEWIGLSEVKGYGERIGSTPIGDISGTYEAPMYYGIPEESKIFLKQTGSAVEGCVVYTNSYDKSQKTVQLLSNGAMANSSLLTFTQNILNTEDKISRSNPAIFVFSPDRKLIYSRIIDDVNNAADIFAQSSVLGMKIGNDVGSCPQWTAKKSTLADELESSGRARLYGINFDTNSDVIKAESFTILDKIVQVAKERPDWKFGIEGHTDSVAEDAYNLNLSERRAMAVKTYIVKAGISEDRLDVSGLGETKPIGDNASEIGRAQNRRVELVKK